MELSELEVAHDHTGARVVNVRSPEEFADDHIPGAVSVPLFSDFERKVVGYLYKNRGKDRALDWGQARVIPRLEELTEDLVRGLDLDGQKDPRPRVVCCARGGLRSLAVTAHLTELGYPVQQLAGGYRSYRASVRESIQNLPIPGAVSLHGLTGCNKTEVLRAIARRFPQRVIDLEGYAGHRSSLLGDIGLEPTSQKTFETRMAFDLQHLEGPWTVIEWEGTRIGNRHLARPVHEQLVRGKHILLEAPMERRVANLSRDYVALDGGKALAERLRKFVGLEGIDQARVDRWIELLDSGDTDTVGRELLEIHYDPRYRHGMARTEMDVTLESHEDAERTADEVLAWIEDSESSMP